MGNEAGISKNSSDSANTTSSSKNVTSNVGSNAPDSAKGLIVSSSINIVNTSYKYDLRSCELDNVLEEITRVDMATRTNKENKMETLV